MEISKPKARMLVKNRALYDVGILGDALCAEVLEVVLKTLDAEGAGCCVEGAGGCAPYAGGSGRCAPCAVGPRGHALYAVLYSGSRGGRAVFAGGAEGAELMRCALLEMPEAVEGVRCILKGY